MAEAKKTNYGNESISSLKGADRVRKRPGVIFGSDGLDGCEHAVFEILSNSIDEAREGHGKLITVTRYLDHSIEVEDMGRGCPVDYNPKEKRFNWELVYCELYAGGKYNNLDGDNYEYSLGLNGLGACATQYASRYMDVTVWRDGNKYSLHFERGQITGKKGEELKIEPTDRGKKTGTLTRWLPDLDVFTDINIPASYFTDVLRRQAVVNAGITFRFRDQVGGKFETQEFLYENGIKDYVDYLVKVRKATPVEEDVISFEAEDLKLGISAELAMQWTTAYSEAVHTFANTISTTEGGTHEEGFRAALTSLVNRYARDKGILKDKDENLSGDDVREGLTAVISVKLTNPQFEGQTKTKLGNSEAKTFVQRVMTDKLGDWFDAHPAEAKNIIQKAIEASRARLAAKKARENTRRKSIFESAGMPDKLKDCQSNNPEECELFIVEGDSAGGSAIQGRNPITQAILPLRGKILNTERASLDRMMKSDTIESLITAVGGGYGEDFDISKVRYHKVIIMADADVDGAHIATLNLTLFFRYMRPMITAGYVYVAMPPLYRLKWTKGPHDFVYTDAERDRVLAEGKANGRQLPKGEGIQRYKGLGEMSYQELWETTMDPEHRILKQVQIEDAAAADETFSMLMGDEVEPRRLFIQRNAHNARWIDA